MFRGPSSVDKSENPDLEEAAINQERKVDLETEARGKGVTPTQPPRQQPLRVRYVAHITSHHLY